MSKKLVTAVLSVALLVGGATTAFAATDNDKLTEIKDLYKQIFGIQEQIIDKQVEAGVFSKEQAELYKNNLELRQKYQEEAIENGTVYGPGYGCGGYGQGMGYGMGNGRGPGYGMMGGYAPANGAGPWGNPAPSGYSY